jgi:K+-sensing histidine kinase KdpD
MTKRISASLAIIVFAICLLIGGFEANNTFTTSVQRALVAMIVTLFVGLIVGAMAQKMLDENLKSQEEKLQRSSAENKTAENKPSDR